MPNLTDAECLDFLCSLFPRGVQDAAVIAELCPEGWEGSPLFACFHPGPERLFEEHRAFYRNLSELFPHRKAAEAESEREPGGCETLGEYLAKHPWEAPRLSPEAAIEEPAELIGLCLWDVFSNNHDVVAADGRLVHLGSFRGSGGMIADFFSGPPWRKEEDADDPWSVWDEGDYLRFYMGTCWMGGRADLTRVYQLIFRRIQAVGGDWRYAFPRVHLVDFGGALVPAPPGDYDPSAAFAKEQEREVRAAETYRLQRELDERAREAMRQARAMEPPETVRAYQSLFGRFPVGWPPDPYAEPGPESD